MKSIPSILVVDDNRDWLMTFGHLLGALGIGNVRKAASAREALRVLRDNQFAVILCDYRMDGMSGVELLEELRSRGNTTPVILMSGAPDREGVVRASRFHKVDFFPKPFRLPDLMHSLDRMVVATPEAAA